MRRLLIIGLAGLTVLGVLAGIGAFTLLRARDAELGKAVGPLPVPFATPQPSDRLPVAGQPRFWAGLNYPWKTGQDFGTGAWGHSGVSDPTTYREIDADFANMAAEGVRVVKWRIFSDARYGVQFDTAGRVSGVDDFLLKDVDAALEIAQHHDMYLVFTLFSSGLWTADCQSAGVQLGGHADWLTDTSKRQALVDNAIVPLINRAATSDRVLAYEIIAEPEWGIQELNQEQDVRIKVPLAPVRDFVNQITQTIHKHSHSLATVESNRFSNMTHWRQLGLDYYSFSWYDWLEPYEPIATPASSATLDRPVVVGEYPAGGSAYYQVPQILDLASSLGYAGAFGWSYWSGDNISHWHDVAPTFSTWVADHWTDANLGASAVPPSHGTIHEQAYPYTYRDFALQLAGGDVVADMRIDVPSGEAYVPHAYLYQVGNTQPLEDVRLSAAPGQPGVLAAHFTSATEGPAYTVSLAIFDPSGALKKWFNTIGTFAISGGALTIPQVDTLTTELGCGAS